MPLKILFRPITIGPRKNPMIATEMHNSFLRLPKTINEDLIVVIVMVVAAIGIATEAVVAIVIVIKNAVDAKNKKKLPLQCSIYFLSMIFAIFDRHVILSITMTHNL